MMENLTVYIDRLRDGEETVFDESIPAKALDVNDGELRFNGNLSVKGKAYLAETHLVLQLDANVQAEVPCTVCTEWTPARISLKKYYITKPLDEIPSGVFPFGEQIREEILLEVPQFAECGDDCPSRKNLRTYYGKESADDETHFPFKDL